MKIVKYLIVIILALISITSYGQDFGFGFDDTDDSSPVSFSFSGDAYIKFPFYFKDYKFDWKEIAGANLNFNLESKYIDVISSFNINYDSISEFWDKDASWGKWNHTPLFIDEFFIRAYAGPVSIEAGLRKLNWGRADSGGPLDVTNPVDFTDLRYITYLHENKIARPMVHAVWNAGSFSKLEAVFIPNFAGHRFAQDGRWTPSQYSNMYSLITDSIITSTRPIISTLPQQTRLQLLRMLNEMTNGFSLEFPDTSSIDNFQSGLRFAATINSVDLGAQYFYGNLFRPNFTANGMNVFTTELITWLSTGMSIPPGPPDLSILNPKIIYTRYHQFGVDYAQVLFGFNTRCELAFNLTEDFDGSDPSLQNPFIAWSLGFDRDLFWGINLNMQCNQTIRLFNSKILGDPVYDCEAGANMTNTRLTTRLSKKFLRDDLETRATVIWDIENKDCYLIPSVIYTLKDFMFDITAGFFLGDKNGELGQYHGNNFIRLGALYRF